MELPEVKVKTLKDGTVLQQDGQEIVIHDNLVDDLMFRIVEGMEARDARKEAANG